MPDKKQLGRMNAELARLYTALGKARSKVFIQNMVDSLKREFEDRFGVFLNDGTLNSVLACRSSDFEEYLRAL